MLIKSSLGLSFGVVFSVLLFKRRAWPAWVGLGFGAGRAWEEADGTLISISHFGSAFRETFDEVGASGHRGISSLELGQRLLAVILASSFAGPSAMTRFSAFLRACLSPRSKNDWTNFYLASFRRGDSPIRDALRR